jgi:hypothetical protein
MFFVNKDLYIIKVSFHCYIEVQRVNTREELS